MLRGGVGCAGGWIDGTLCSPAAEVFSCSSRGSGEERDQWRNLPALNVARKLHGWVAGNTLRMRIHTPFFWNDVTALLAQHLTASHCITSHHITSSTTPYAVCCVLCAMLRVVLQMHRAA